MQLLENETKGAKTILVIRLDFPDKQGNPDYKEIIQNQINNEVSGHLSDYSYGLTSVSATVSESIYRVSMVSSEYISTSDEDNIDEDDLFNEAVAAYRADVKDVDPFDDYDMVGLIFPRITDANWNGLGTIGTANAKFWLNGAVVISTIVHELGHNYGLLHANYWNFNSSNPESLNSVDPTGTSEEYGDFMDVMGDGDAEGGDFHMAAKRFLGWLGESQIQRIDEPGDSGTYRIYRFDDKDASSTHLQGLEIKKSETENYWVGFRKKAYYEGYAKGAYVLWERAEGATHNQGWIIDTSPQTDRYWDDAGISGGTTYSDPTAGVHITTLGFGGNAPDEYLDVVVNYGNYSGNVSPTLSLNIPNKGTARNPIIFEAQGSDLNGDELAYFWDLGDGRNYPNTATLETSLIVGGTYNVTVIVNDLKGGFQNQSAQITIDDPLNEWAFRPSPTSNAIFTLAKNDNCVVAAGEDVFLHSSDGIKWTDQTPLDFSNLIIWDISWTGSKFVAVGFVHEVVDHILLEQYPVIYTSADGIQWDIDFSLPSAQYGRFLGVSSNASGDIVVVASDFGKLFRSTGESDWQEVDLGLDEDVSLMGVEYENGFFVTGGRKEIRDDEGDNRYLFRSVDGLNWADMRANSGIDKKYLLGRVQAENGIFFFVGSHVSYNEGASWEKLDLGSGSYGFWGDIAWGDGTYASFDRGYDSSTIILSLDGLVWRKLEYRLPLSILDITYFNNSFLVVGNKGEIMQSQENLTGYEKWVAAFYDGEGSAASANPDGDWANNIMEWALGSAPDDNNSIPAGPSFYMDLRHSPYPRFSLERFNVSNEAEFVIEKSTNMVDWEPMTTNILVDNDDLLIVQSYESVEVFPCFFRIKVLER